MLYSVPKEVSNLSFDVALADCEYYLVNGLHYGCEHNDKDCYWHGRCSVCGSCAFFLTSDGEYECMIRQCQAKFAKCEHFELLKETYEEIGVIHCEN